MKKIEHFYQRIQGWFDYQDIFSDVVNKFGDNSHFVEIGAWKGCSTSFMAVEIANSGKKIQFDCIDTWNGSEENINPTSPHYDQLTLIEDGLYNEFLKNIEPVRNFINPIRTTSVDASKLYEDGSLDFIFIDASHDYDNVRADVLAWLPKLKPDGIIAGHDYTSYEGVKRAVDEIIPIEMVGTSWICKDRYFKHDI